LSAGDRFALSSLLTLSAGLFFAILLFADIFSRLVFDAPMPDALKPTLLIVVAPFAVGCTSYAITIGRFDVFAQRWPC
jgi:tellurite resistance protein